MKNHHLDEGERVVEKAADPGGTEEALPAVEGQEDPGELQEGHGRLLEVDDSRKEAEEDEEY